LLGLRLLAEKESIQLKLENKKKIFKNYKKIKAVLRKLVKEKKKDPKFSMPSLFKNDELVKEIKQKI
jgi:hypothetical protein